jgi:Flp pilus assembly protein TadG
MVEFALVMPIFVLFLFGIIEFGSTYSQLLNLRHGAREGSRLIAVNYNPSAQTGQAQADTIGAAICKKMDLTHSAKISLSVDGSVYPTDATSPGRFATVTVKAPVTQVTGFFNPILGPITLTSTVQSRIEQQVTWTNAGLSFASPTQFSCP